MTRPGKTLTYWPEYKYLNAWLQAATKGLSEGPRARIREEIGDHFHQAIDEGVRAGLTEDAAAEQAVEGLGNPKTARRAFRRTYPTRWEAYNVRRFIDLPTPPASSHSLASLVSVKPLWDPDRERRLRPYFVTLMVGLGAIPVAMDPRAGLPHLGFLALMAAAALVLVLAVPRLARRGRERAAVALGASAEVALWAGFTLIPAMTFTYTLGMRLAIVAVFAVVTGAMYLPLLRKLNRIQTPSV